MIYTLKLFDTPLLRFEVLENLAEPVVRIVEMDEKNKHLLPLDMEPNENGLVRWIRHRAIPKNRAFVNVFLSKCGLSANRPMDVIAVCKGLSLNDSYWINDETTSTTYTMESIRAIAET